MANNVTEFFTFRFMIHCVKVSKYRAFSGPYFPFFGPEKIPYLETFHGVFFHGAIKT